MKKYIQELQAKTISELEREATKVRQEIAKLKLESKVNPSKDTNFLQKKRKTLARILTVISQKQTEEEIKQLNQLKQ